MAGFSKTFWGPLLAESFWVACLFSLYAGTAAPEVNESHYWVKAKHFWDSSFADRDLFLGSADAHWFFFTSVGALSSMMSLPAAVWSGRILGWFAVALGWCCLAKSVVAFRWAGAITAPLWLAGMHWGHLSGEWVIGGCEAKVFAYGCALIGLSCILVNRWSIAWCWLGLAAAFHVLTGGWIALAAILSYVLLKGQSGCGMGRSNTRLAIAERRVSEPEQPAEDPGSESNEWEALRRQWLGLLIGGCLALPGLIPALMLNRGVDAATAERGAMIYVYQRLPHHLSPMRFASERWLAFSVLVAIAIAMLWGYRRCRWRALGDSRPPASEFERATAVAFGLSRLPADRSLLPLVLITAIVSAIACIGVLIDVSLSKWATNWSASLLRFYWFRWNDVVWPILLTLLAGRLVQLGAVERMRGWRWMAILMLAVPGPLLLGMRYLDNNRATIPPADRASLAMRSETSSTQRRVYDDWLDVCYWIRSNSPPEALFLTPRFQQTFKWYAQRAEVACWKDAPQDALGLIEWERRMLEIFPRSSEGYGIPMTLQHLIEMRLRYKIDFAVVDRRIQTQPPLLPIVHSNRTYVVFDLTLL